MSEPNTLYAGAMFPAAIVEDMFNLVQGRSALAKLSAQKAILFNGTTEMVFNLDGDCSIVGEGGKKPEGKASMEPKVIKPLKFLYQARVSDEFLYAAEEARLQTLANFADGFAKKIARGIDISAMHGLDPATRTEASFAATNSFDGLVENVIAYDASKIDENIEDAIAKIRDEERDFNGLALSPTAGTALSKIKVNGVVQYPEFRFGQNPNSFEGMGSDVNPTVEVKAADADTDHVIVGDFQNAFKWGYAKNIPLEVIQYGDPDATGRDLKAYNEVCLRAEAYVGWGILDAASFAIVNTATGSDS